MADEQNVDTSTQTDSSTSGQETGTGTTETQKPAGSPNTQVAAPGADRKAEDERNRGILADLQKERRARQEIERQVSQFKNDLAAERRRVQVLAGVNPQTPEQTEAAEVRARLLQVMPELEGLTADDIKALRELREQSGSLREATEHHYKLHGRKMLDSVVDGVAAQMGGKLTPRQQQRVEQAYVNIAEADPEFLARHDAGDKSLVDQFVREWVEDFFEPARRKVTQSEVERARKVPSGRDRSTVTVGGKKIDYNNPKSVEDALVASFKEHGGAFGE